MGHGLHALPGHHTVPDARRQGVTTEGISIILRREEPPQAALYGGQGDVFSLSFVHETLLDFQRQELYFEAQLWNLGLLP